MSLLHGLSPLRMPLRHEALDRLGHCGAPQAQPKFCERVKSCIVRSNEEALERSQDMNSRLPFAWVVLLAGAVSWLGPPSAQAQEFKCRIQLQDATFFVAIDDAQLKMAATPAGLEAVEPTAPLQTRRTPQYVLSTFPPVEFPRPPRARAGFSPVLATFAFRADREGNRVLRGIVETTQPAEDGVVWVYQRRIHADLEATAPENAPMATAAPDAKRFRLSGHFCRIRVDEKTVVFVSVEGQQLRMATTLEGLATAEPTRAARSSERGHIGHSNFPSVTLPKHEGADDAASVVAARWTYRAISHPNRPPRHTLFASLDVPRVDAQGNTWTFRQSRGTGLSPEGPINAPLMELADLDNLELQVSISTRGVDAPRTFGVVVQLTAGNARISDVRKNGREVRAEVQVVARDGTVVQRDTRPLRGLGFL